MNNPHPEAREGTMNEAKAKEIWQSMNDRSNSPYVHIDTDMYCSDVILDGYFLADELEAIVWMIRNKVGNNATKEMQ